jgi:hypothetical protein
MLEDDITKLLQEKKTVSRGDIAKATGYSPRHLQRILPTLGIVKISRYGRRNIYSLLKDRVSVGVSIDERTKLAESVKSADTSEKSFEDKLCSAFDHRGILYERQKRVDNGIIDILVHCHPLVIIEVKRTGTPRDLMQAIVQLKFYAACFEKARLFIATPNCVSEDQRRLLKLFNVGEISGIILEEGKIYPEFVNIPGITDIKREARRARS